MPYINIFNIRHTKYLWKAACYRPYHSASAAIVCISAAFSSSHELQCLSEDFVNKSIMINPAMTVIIYPFSVLKTVIVAGSIIISRPLAIP